MISRIIEKHIKDKLFSGKVIIIYGARQVGKTTLCKKILAEYKGKAKYLNGDLFSTQELFDYKNPQRIIESVKEFKMIVIDEAQNISNIGMVLKILVDRYPEKQFIATGSSSFELANKINEPLTGRNYKFHLYPISIEELKSKHDTFFIYEQLEQLLIYGQYPEIISSSLENKKENLHLLAGDYLYRDMFKYDGIQKSDYLKSILKLLALQIGNMVSYNEIGQKLGLHHGTVKSYIDVLEQAFVVFRLNSFSKNLRNEITKGVKIYFYDTGIRNSLIQNYNNVDLRNDIGNLWENFIISERKKYLENNKILKNSYFWRNHAKAEIDYIEEYNGNLDSFELKWGKKIVKPPKAFTSGYKDSRFELINKNNFISFVTSIEKDS